MSTAHYKSWTLLSNELAELRHQMILIKEQLRVADVCSDYHMKRCLLLTQANENANKAIGALCNEIDLLYKKDK